MDNETLKFSHFVGVVKRRSALVFFSFLAGMSLTLLITFGLPPVYESAATILIEQQNIPNDLVRSTITSYADERIQVISQRVMSTDNLVKLIEEFGLYEQDEAESNVMERVIDMREAILVEPISADVIDPRSGRPTQATIAFSVGYENTSPKLARDVTRALANLFLEENQRDRSEQTEEAVAFLEGQLGIWQNEVAKLEGELADFKLKYQNVLPENAQVNREKLERDERRLSDLRNEIRQIEERVRFLRSDRRRLVEEAGGAVDRMAELQAEYARATALYAPDHPDIIRIRKEMDVLSQAGVGGGADGSVEIAQVRAELAAAEERYTEDHPDVKRLRRTLAILEAGGVSGGNSERFVNSPAIRMIDTDIRDATAGLSALREEYSDLEAEMQATEALMQDMPEVERQYRLLSRRYEDAALRYDEIRSKLATAQLSRQLETEQLGERFSQIEKPRLPAEPSRPNRLGILALGLVLSGVIAVAAMALVEAGDSSVRNPRDVFEVLGIPPLALIPQVENKTDRRQRFYRRLRYAVATVAIVAGTAAGLQMV